MQAAVGLYSAMSDAISQHTQEIGVRMALGASRFKVVQMVTRESVLLTIPGMVLGILGAVMALRFFKHAGRGKPDRSVDISWSSCVPDRGDSVG